jgi:hypothetical protein
MVWSVVVDSEVFSSFREGGGRRWRWWWAPAYDLIKRKKKQEK